MLLISPFRKSLGLIFHLSYLKLARRETYGKFLETTSRVFHLSWNIGPRLLEGAIDPPSFLQILRAIQMQTGLSDTRDTNLSSVQSKVTVQFRMHSKRNRVSREHSPSAGTCWPRGKQFSATIKSQFSACRPHECVFPGRAAVSTTRHPAREKPPRAVPRPDELSLSLSLFFSFFPRLARLIAQRQSCGRNRLVDRRIE